MDNYFPKEFQNIEKVKSSTLLLEAFINAQEKYEMFNSRDRTPSINSYEDFKNIDNMNEITDITISSRYNDDIFPDFKKFINLKFLSIFTPIQSEILENINVDKLIKLNAHLSTSFSQQILESKNIEELDIYYGYENAKCIINLNKMPNLKSLYIRHADSIVILGDTKNLKSLIITYAKRISISYITSLEKLSIVDSSISENFEVQFSNSLRQIDFGYSLINSNSFSLPNYDKIEKIDIYNSSGTLIDKIKKIEELRRITIIDNIDKEVDSFNRLNLFEPIARVNHYRKNFDKLHPFIKKQISDKTDLELFQSQLKLFLWKEFYKLNPGKIGISDYDVKIKERCLKLLQYKYPFYDYIDLENQIIIEKNMTLDKFRSLYSKGFVFMSRSSLLVIDRPSVKKGSSFSVDINIESVPFNDIKTKKSRREIDKNIVKKAIKEYLPDVYDKNLQISLNCYDLYNTTSMDKVEFAIVFALFTYYNDINIDKDTIVIGELNAKSIISQWEIWDKWFNRIKKFNPKKVFMFTKKTLLNFDELNLNILKFDSFEAFLNYIQLEERSNKELIPQEKIEKSELIEYEKSDISIFDEFGESLLHKHGYRVGKTGMNRTQRHLLIEKLVLDSILSIEQIVKTLCINISLFSERDSYKYAVFDWKDDLAFISKKYHVNFDISKYL